VDLSELIIQTANTDKALAVVWDWARNIFSLLGVASALPVGISWLLSRKNANKKLDLDEKGAEVSEFQAFNAIGASLVSQAHQAMVDAQTAATEAKAEAAAAKREASKYRGEREEMKHEMLSLTESVRKLRDMIKGYVTRTGQPLTEEEQAVFDQTVDPRSLPARRRKR